MIKEVTEHVKTEIHLPVCNHGSSTLKLCLIIYDMLQCLIWRNLFYYSFITYVFLHVSPGMTEEDNGCTV